MGLAGQGKCSRSVSAASQGKFSAPGSGDGESPGVWGRIWGGNRGCIVGMRNIWSLTQKILSRFKFQRDSCVQCQGICPGIWTSLLLSHTVDAVWELWMQR